MARIPSPSPPPTHLTNTQRKFVHKLSEQLGLKSKSHGKGKDRKVVVRKVLGGGGAGVGNGLFAGGSGNDRESYGSLLPTEAEYGQVPQIDMGRRGKEALRRHMSNFPALVREEVKLREIGSLAILQYNDKISRNDWRGSGRGNLALPTANSGAPPDPVQSKHNRGDARPARQRQGRMEPSRKQHKRMIWKQMESHRQAQQQMMSHPQ
jgi:hypothetical protein